MPGRAQDQQPVDQELGHVMSSLRAFGFAWLKVPTEEEHHFRQLHNASEQGNHLDEAGIRIRSKTLLRHTVGNRTTRVPHAVYEAADKVTFN